MTVQEVLQQCPVERQEGSLNNVLSCDRLLVVSHHQRVPRHGLPLSGRSCSRRRVTGNVFTDVDLPLHRRWSSNDVQSKRYSETITVMRRGQPSCTPVQDDRIVENYLLGLNRRSKQREHMKVGWCPSQAAQLCCLCTYLVLLPHVT